ncbi:MAG: TRAP transporter small permease [Desulfitobacteriaceae bacterium]
MANNSSLLDKSFGLLQKILNVVTALILGVLVLIVFSNVLGRYVFHSSLAWSEEISRFLLIWMVFLGSIIAYINNDHLGLDLLVKVLPLKLAQLIAVIADILVIYAIGLLIKGGYRMTVESWDWLSPATSTPYGYVYIIVPIAGTILLLQAVFKTFRHIKELF